MKKVFLFLAIALSAALMGCATAPAVEPSAQYQSNGYTIQDDTVIFEFFPAKHLWVTNGVSGDWVRLNSIPLRSVAVAGDFNGWGKEPMLMVFDGEGGFYFPLEKERLTSGVTYQFKFLINDEWWVEPPKNSLNAKATDLSNGSANYSVRIR